MFGRWLSRGHDTEVTGSDALDSAVRRELPAADAETIAVVSSMTGLLGAVAYADRDYSLPEEQRVLAELERIAGMTPDGARAIASALRTNVLAVSSLGIPHYCRTLREVADRELRLEILTALVDLAAADDVIDTAEVNVLRQITGALGLTQDDYNAAQARYRNQLAVLRHAPKRD